MIALIEKPAVSIDLEAEGRLAVLKHFKAQEIQHLGRDDLLTAKTLAGHGAEWGHWTTPESMMPRQKASHLNIDLSKRLVSYLAKESFSSACPAALIEEGVMTLTRIALLMKLLPTGGSSKNSKGQRLKASTISNYMNIESPRIIARAIRRKADSLAGEGLFQFLTEADILEFNTHKRTRIEIERLRTLVSRGVWSDEPARPDIRQTTNPATVAHLLQSDPAPEPYSPLPNEWLTQIGPRVLWVIEDMGPNLLRLLEDMVNRFKGVDRKRSKRAIGIEISTLIEDHLEANPWGSSSGQPLMPPFKFTTANGKHGSDTCEWPPRTWEHITNLCLALQASHIFITLLMTAGRIGEVATLNRDCVKIGRDGKSYLHGYTYKLADNLFGDARTWPAPDILGQCLGQQARLARAWDWLPKSLGDEMPHTPRFGSDLWVSIGVRGNTGSGLKFNFALQRLACRLDMSPTPGGKNVHAHRFRKTIGRLAGVALFNSPLVLKRLFGHKSVEMTLHYILCDPSVREEADKVLRELRILHCAEALEEIHQAMNDGSPLPGHGGPGAARLITAVRNEDAKLNQSGRFWSDGSAYDLALLLSMQGQGWRLIKDNIICSKLPGEVGLCQKKQAKGEPNTANCQPLCDNRIVFARKRRDVEQNIQQYLDIARQARDDGQLLVLAATLENAQDEWVNFSDLTAKYQADPEIQALFALCEEPEAEKP